MRARRHSHTALTELWFALLATATGAVMVWMIFAQ